jgi:hypothetical protein
MATDVSKAMNGNDNFFHNNISKIRGKDSRHYHRRALNLTAGLCETKAA